MTLGKRGPGRPRKTDEPRKTVKVYGLLPAELAEVIRRIAEADRRSTAQMVTILLEEALRARQR